MADVGLQQGAFNEMHALKLNLAMLSSRAETSRQ